MGLFDWLTGGGKAADKIISGVSAGIDMTFYTEEEKSIANQKILDFKLKYAQSTTAQNVARRIIAIAVTGMWVFLVLLAVAAYLIDLKQFSEFIFKVLQDNVNTPFSIIVGFYFLAHITRQVKR